MMGMTNTLRKALPAFLLALVALWVLTGHQAQAQASPNDCTAFTFSFTGDANGQTVTNLSQNQPCINWRITLSTTGTLTSSVTFQTSPDGTTWTSVPNTPCSAVLTPCVIQGANPITGAQGTAYISAYGARVRVITSGSAGAGTGTVRVYGAKGATANAPPVAALTFQTTDPSGICVVGTPNIQNTTTGTQFACVGGTWQLIIAAGSSGTLIYYLTNTASDIATYLQATALPFTPKTTLAFPTLATGTDTLQNWSTNAGVPNLTFIPQGIFNQHIHARRTGGGTVTIHAQFWEVSSTGVDIAMIGQTEDSPALVTTEQEYDLEFATGTVYNLASSSSRIVSRVFAVVSGSLPTVDIFVGGTADSRLGLPSNTVDATNFVPYVGATAAVNLGVQNLSTTGNVSVGTPVPTAAGALLTVQDIRNTSPRGILSVQTSTDTVGARVGFAKARGTPATPTTVVSGDTLGRSMFRGYDGTNYLEMASIEVTATGTIAATRVPTLMMFSTATDATPSVLTERLRIDAAGLSTFTLNGIGATPTDSVLLTNTTAAANNAQQVSPANHWRSNGWETTGPSSQSVDFRAYSLPAQGTTASGSFRIDSSINGAAYSNVMSLTSAGVLSATSVNATAGMTVFSGFVQAQRFIVTSSSVPNNGMYLPAANTVGISSNSAARMQIDANGVVQVAATGVLQQLPRTTDPTCSTTADIGKFWFDNTTTTTAAKKCVNVAGTLTWVAF